MAFQFVLFAACVAAANAGVLAPAPLAYAAPATYATPAYAAPASYGYSAGIPSVSSVSQNTLRNFGNTAQVSTFSKALDTPYSSVRKTDTRITNDAQYAYAAPAAYHGTYAAPAAYAPAAYAAPAYAQAAYAAPAYAQAAYAAPVAHAAYAAPVAHAAYAAPVAKTALLGVAYSAAPAVAHMTFQGYGINYAY